ncbi:radical SAM protein [candidate division WOR-3 bacterium]|nr:radical SAM protein [candidate division WOR-3 bacterium]
MFKYLFGPVPSRRLKMSLGIDLIPRKYCSLDCVYCEVGKTTCLTTSRREYYSQKDIKDEIKAYFKENPDPDYVTFSGQGEPTLNTCIGDIIDHVKEIRPQIPIAVLTNGTLLTDKQTRKAILNADVVLPSLDAATEDCFQKINRPAKGLSAKDNIRGLCRFRSEYGGQIWLEVFILPFYNDSEKELEALKKAVEKIKPDKVQLNTLDRPGVLPYLQKAPLSLLEKIKREWRENKVEIISAVPITVNNISRKKDVEAVILETLSRRPCTAEDLSRMTGFHINEINKILSELREEKKIKVSFLERGNFYSINDK